MEILIVGLWIFLLLAIPVGLIYFAGVAYAKDEEISTIMGKMLISSFFYLIATFFTFFYLMVNNREIHEPQIANPDSKYQIISLLIVYIYGFAGYFLCSFINGSFLKPCKISFLNSKKPQTIFDKK